MAYISTTTNQPIDLRGSLVDTQTRCSHYHSPIDIIAIKFKCCQVYYPCYQCHDEAAGHSPEVWPQNDLASDILMIYCGNCRNELTYAQYTSGSACCYCHHGFNPKCSLHYHLYFEAEAA